MESVEFYARLLFNARLLGGPKELSKQQVERLYEIRRQFGMTGRHPADLCPNAKAGLPSCHTCGGNCGNCENKSADSGKEADLIAEITRKVMQQLSK